jgi:hypothetical protein
VSRRQRERKARRRRQSQRRAVMGTAIVGAALAAPAVAHAADIPVTSANDSGTGTLRQAITTSQDGGHPGADRIVISSALSGDTVHLASGLPLISQSLEIDGPANANLKLDGNGVNHQILDIQGAPSVHISNLTLRNGTAGAGGAIYSNYTPDLTIRHSTFSGNSATNVGGAVSAYKDTLTVSDSHFFDNDSGTGGGGAIWSAYSTVVIGGSTIESNTAGTAGGGVYDQKGGSLSIGGSTLDSNTAQTGGGAAARGAPLSVSRSTITGNTAQAAGGLYAYQGSPVTIDGSTVVGNHATGGTGGGGVFYISPGSISNSTFLANTASGGGGGFRAGFATDPLTVTNSTITGNRANATGGGILADAGYAATTPVDLESSTVAGNSAVIGGGGVFEFNGSASPSAPGVILHNTIVGANSATGGQLDLGRGAKVDPFRAAFSLVQHPPPSGDLTETAPGSNVFGQDPKLAAPADNGGPTQTQALEAGSPAIDAGSSSLFCDQRGFTRPIGRAPDIGAFEFESSAAASCTSPPPAGGPPPEPPRPGPVLPPNAVVSLAGAVHATSRGVRFTVVCAGAPCAGRGVLTVRRRLRGTKVIGLRKVRIRSARVGSRSFALTVGQRKTITVNLNRLGRKLLRQFRREPVKLVVSQGATTVKTARVVIKKKT